jgi:transposase
LTVPTKELYAAPGKEKLEALELSPLVRIQVDVFFAQVQALSAALDCLKTQILGYAAQFKSLVTVLTSVPGISPFVALGLIADIGDIEQFKTAKKLTAYLGVVPRVHESNGKSWTGHITKQGRKLSRALLSQIIHHFIGSSKMYEEQYESLKKKKGAAKAIVAMMRRLLVIVFKMMKRKEMFYSVDKANHTRKLEAVEKAINSLEKIDASDIQKMRDRARLIYDLGYREQVKLNEALNPKKNVKKTA